MAIELARAQALQKPWGVADLRPWSRSADPDGRLIGEIWYERSGTAEPALLLKLLFTSQPLSIQVHPDDAFARSIGLSRGKTEAWYVLSAVAGARVALGLKQPLSRRQLREAVNDGSIVECVSWQEVAAGDVVFVPAGTIHAIGAGLVMAEIQQRSDTTFRLFDFGRKRELHTERAVEVSDTGQSGFGGQSRHLSDERTLLVFNPHFVFERFELPPRSSWHLEAERETWMLVVKGNARVETFDIAAGDAVFAQSDRVDIHAGPAGLVALVAYTGDDGVHEDLLQHAADPGLAHGRRPDEVKAPASRSRTTGMAAHASAGAQS